MSSKPLAQRIFVSIVLAVLLASCAGTRVPTAAPTIDQQPTFNAIQTQAVQTAVAAMTQNAPTAAPLVLTSTSAPATAAPTETQAPTNTPLPPTAVPTATAVPKTATPMVLITSTLSTYNCTITDVSPKPTDKIRPGGDFDGRWVVKNTGSQTWGQHEVDFRYSSGTKFQTHGDAFDLTADVTHDNSYTVIVDMLAPKDPGTYYATWQLVYGNQPICSLGLTVRVAQ